MEQKISRMKELAAQLKEASRAYYAQDEEIMSNYEYDRLYDELEMLEKETGIILAGSPTVTVGYEAVTELPRERHAAPMLSLDKTKDIEVLRSFAGSQKILLSWKLDGLTVVLTYRDGMLQKAVTRGNGEIGEVITGNARVFRNIPLTISYRGELVLRGEAVIRYPDFERINEQIEDVSARYKNPRNLCSGSVRQLNNRITAERSVYFFAFGLVSARDVDFHNSRKEQLLWLSAQGFDVVEYRETTADTLDEAVRYFSEKIRTYEIPSDGLVAIYDDIAYGDSLGRTAKFPRNAFAFKWKDETAQTRLLDIEWSASRTGLINPVAIFEPVELEGTTVSRASVHNVSILRALKLGIGDVITVYKANMIIPQIAENLTGSDTVRVPDACPVCGMPTRIQTVGDVQTLLCDNPSCLAKKIKSLTQFVSRSALNIDGLSEATLEKFVNAGILHALPDLFHLGEHRDTIVQMDGFGEKSWQNLTESVEKARVTTLPRLLFGLGIEGIGAANAAVICRSFDDDIEKIMEADEERLSGIDGIGPVLAASIRAYFGNEENRQMIRDLLRELKIEKTQREEALSLDGKTFVVTGSVTHFANRDELKAFIAQRGGKVAGSVSSKTDYLINNDAASSSSKNKKAKELGVPVITEAQFLQLCGIEE